MSVSKTMSPDFMSGSYRPVTRTAQMSAGKRLILWPGNLKKAFVPDFRWRVTDVKIIISSHSDLLDKEARKTLLQWRFVPKTVKTVTVPVETYPMWHR